MEPTEEKVLLLSTSYRPNPTDRQEREEVNPFKHELAVLKEWAQIQRYLYTHILKAHPSMNSWRSIIETAVSKSTRGYAQIWWEPLSRECIVGGGQLIEIRYQQTRYGVLKLTSGYLASRFMPDIPHAFAHLCALLISLAEHRTLVQALLRPLEPLDVHESLTARELDVLQSMAFGEDETTAAQRLGIAETTVRTHRHHVYRRLEVRSPREAVLRSFALRLLDWLEPPYPRN